MNTERIFRGSPHYYERVQNVIFGQHQMDFMSINFPPLCNYNCSFCCAADSLHASRGNVKREMLPIETMTDIIRQAHHCGLRHIEISGEGEPTLPMFRTYLQDVVRVATELGIHVAIFTNGSLVDRPFLQFLREHNTSLIVSIKYFDAKRYNNNVGRRMFEAIRRNIELIQDIFACIETVDNCHVHNFGLFSGVFDDNEMDNAMLRKYCDERDIFFSLSTQIPQGRLADTNVDYVYQDAIVSQHQHNSIILAQSSLSEVGFSVCGTFYYGIGINCYGDRLFDAHAGIPIGNISQMGLLQALERQRTLIHTLFTEYNCQSYCPLRDVNYQAFLEECLLANGGPGTPQ